MKDYISREDAMSHPFANGHYDKKHANEDFILGHECYKEWIGTLPAADVVEVVRCRDCRFYDESTHMCELYGVKHWEKFYCMDGGRGRPYFDF